MHLPSWKVRLLIDLGMRGYQTMLINQRKESPGVAASLRGHVWNCGSAEIKILTDFLSPPSHWDFQSFHRSSGAISKATHNLQTQRRENPLQNTWM